LNKSAAKNKYSSIRFRRWSRKNFAVFSGLHREISIGHIAFNISDKALLKSNKPAFANFTVNSETVSTEEEEKEICNPLFSELSEILIIANSTIDHLAGRSQKYYSHFKQLSIQVNPDIQLFNFKQNQ